MIPNMPDPKQVADAIANVQKQLAQAQSAAVNESLRRQLNDVAGKFQKASAKMVAMYPQELAKMQQRQEDIKNQSKAMMDKVAQLKQQAAEAQKAREAPPPPPKPIGQAIEPGLGQTLRTELLQRFGHLPKKQAVPPPGDAAPKRKPEGRDDQAALNPGKPDWDTIDIPEEDHL